MLPVQGCVIFDLICPNKIQQHLPNGNAPAQSALSSQNTTTEPSIHTSVVTSKFSRNGNNHEERQGRLSGGGEGRGMTSMRAEGRAEAGRRERLGRESGAKAPPGTNSYETQRRRQISYANFTKARLLNRPEN